MATAAPDIDAQNLAELHIAKDIKKSEYAIVFKQLNVVRDQNPDVKYIYIFRPTEDPTIWEFVVDGDSIDLRSLYSDKDLDGNGIMNDADENIAPGVRYYLPKMEKALV